jgi:hypothetical protein
MNVLTKRPASANSSSTPIINSGCTRLGVCSAGRVRERCGSMTDACTLHNGGSAPATRDLTLLRQNGDVVGRLMPPPPFRPLSRRSGCVPAVRVFRSDPSRVDQPKHRRQCFCIGDNPLNFVSHSRGSVQFCSVCALPSPTSAEGCSSLFGRFTGVGSEVAHSVARALATVRRSNGVCGFPALRFHEDALHRGAKDGINLPKFTSPYLSLQNGHRQLPPAAVPPTAIPMRPDPAHNPTIESVEELSDVGSLVRCPNPALPVQFLDQLLGRLVSWRT